MTNKVDAHMTNLEFVRLHALSGNELAVAAVGPLATDGFFSFQAPYTRRVSRDVLALQAEKARRRAEKMFDSGVRLDAVLPELGKSL